MNRIEKLAILIVDDQAEVLEVYRDVLADDLGHFVEGVSMPGEALRLVHSRLFDMVIVDAKIAYKGAPLGGLLLAEEISRIIGINAVILMSQYNIRHEIMSFNAALAFVPKPNGSVELLDWVQRELFRKVKTLVGSQLGFVVMPFGHPECDEWYRSALQPWMKSAGYTVKRMDEIQHTRAIDRELLSQIEAAHFVIVYTSKINSNVYFEAGYAMALRKYIIVFSREGDILPFDLRSINRLTIRPAPNHDGREELIRFMAGLRGVT